MKKNRFFVNKDLSKACEQPNSVTFAQMSELLKAVTLCHSSSCSVKYGDKSVNKEDDVLNDQENDYLSLYKSEKAQLWFAKSYGYKFVSRKNKLITIHCE